MVVGVARVLDGVLNQFLECRALADELNQLGDAPAAAQSHQLVLLEEQLLDRATFLLIEDLVDLSVASIVIEK